VIDDWGRTPQPFATDDGAILWPPAHQQVFKGLPAVNYSARDIITGHAMWGPNPHPFPPRKRGREGRGHSPVQQMLPQTSFQWRAGQPIQ
jgi:hypothetical protein